MKDSYIRIRDSRTAFRPGETVSGSAHWTLRKEADWLEVRLLWYTDGKGDRDTETVDRRTVTRPHAEGSHEFSLRLPEGPYSHHGRYVSILWAVELVAHRHRNAVRVDLVLDPDAVVAES
ncbi:MAG: hypothetical protein GY716_22490 [bacterium]|nr:hypothetical protein [bacterium]